MVQAVELDPSNKEAVRELQYLTKHYEKERHKVDKSKSDDIDVVDFPAVDMHLAEGSNQAAQRSLT